MNCGGAHSIRDCPKPMVPMNQRPCFSCGKPGCSWSKCPKRRQQPGAKLVDEEAPLDFGMVCDVCDTGANPWQTVQAKKRPQPHTITLGDFMAQKKSQKSVKKKDVNEKTEKNHMSPKEQPVNARNSFACLGDQRPCACREAACSSLDFLICRLAISPF